MNDSVTHNACEATNDEGQYGPWMIVSKRRNRQKGIRTGHGTGSVSSTAWNSSNHLTPVFAEGTNMPIGGPSSSKNMPHRNVNLKTGSSLKYGGKLWASKAPGLFTHKEKATSSPSRTKLHVDDFKRAVTNLKQDNSPGPSLRMPTTYPSSVKGKKSLARNLTSETSTKCAATHCVEGSTENISITPFTYPPLPRSDPNQPSCTTFEFSAKTNVETSCLDGSESDWSLYAHHVGKKRSYSMDDTPKDNNLGINLQSSVRVQLSTQSLDSKD